MQGSKQKRKNDSKVLTPKLPPIPDKLYFTIGEVSRLCHLKTHVIRYWEKEFPQLAPAKRRGNRRYFQRKDILVVRQIRNLLHEQGFTIEGARNKLITEESGIIIEQKQLTMLIDELELIVREFIIN